MNALVSVIIPTFNRKKRLEGTIVSVLNQSYKSIEIVVIDDGSTDETDVMVNSLSKDSRYENIQINYTYQNNNGACSARNLGMQKANGKYLLFLDSDDLLYPSYLDEQIKSIELNDSDCSICDFESIDDNGVVLQYFSNNRHPHEFIKKLIGPSISAVLIKRESLPQALSWNVGLRSTQDLDFLYKYFFSIKKYSYLNKSLFKYCLHSGERISDNYLKGIQYSVLQRSFAEYIARTGKCLSFESRRLYYLYCISLWRHFAKNWIVSRLPKFVKSALKQLLFRSNAGSSPKWNS